MRRPKAMEPAPRPEGAPDGRAWVAPASLFAASAALFAACVYGPLVGRTFFLYDDFAHLQIVQTHGLRALFAEPLAGMFRPAFFTALWLEFRAFGWASPGGYVAVTALVHLGNAALLAAVLRLYGESRAVAALAATFFLVFPAVNEVHVWPACRGDALCVTGMLGALLLLRLTFRARVRWAGAALGALSALCLLGALLSKEFAAVFPLLLVTLALARPGRPAAARAGRVAVAAAIALVAIGLFVWIRSRVMPLASTHYGDAAQLYRGAPLLSNLRADLTALRTVPFFDDEAFGAGAVRATGWLGVAAIALGLRAAGVRAAAALLATTLAFLAPVLWVTLVPGAAVGGHNLYAATLPLCILQALGVASLLEESRADAPGRRRLAAFCGWGLVAGIVLGGAASGNSLSRCYRDAWALSRSALGQVEPFLGEPAVFVRNTPWGFRNGPHVLPCYAYRTYFSGLGRTVPPFRCDGVILETGWRGTIEWTPRRPDAFSDYPSARAGETPVELDLQKRATFGR